MNTSSNGLAVDQAKQPVNRAPVDPSSRNSSESSPPVPRVVVTCASCKATLSVRRVYIGNAVQCKQCGDIFTVPADVATRPMPVVNHHSRDLPGRAPQAGPGAKNQQPGVSDNVLLDQIAQFIAGNNDLRSAHDRLQAEHNELLANRDEIGARLNSMTAELGAIKADLEAERDVLKRDLAEHSSNLVAARFELAQWAQRIEQAEADLHAAVEQRDQLGRELKQCQNDLGLARADLGRSESERQRALEKVEQLTKTLAEQDALLNAERSERQQLADELLALRANAEETARLAAQLISANLIPPEATLASPHELEAAQVQAGELKDKLDQADDIYREMADTLHGIGVQVDSPVRRRAIVEAKF